jgi:cytochrome c
VLLASPAAAGPLHDAVKTNDIAQIRQLIEQGQDVNKVQFPVGSPLHYAAISGNAEIAELLLTEGAEVDLDSSLGTPLKAAALKGNEAVAVELIANGADVLATSGDGTTPLHAAAQGGNASMVELLIESGADVNARSVAESGRPSFAPVHSAGQALHFDIVDLLRAYGATGPTVKPVTALLASAYVSGGDEVFSRACGACHSIPEGSPATAGPNLWGVLGRKKASTENYRYSEAFKRLVGIWTLAEFNAFVASPTDYVPGTSMHAEGIKDPKERANLIAILRESSDDPIPLPER